MREQENNVDIEKPVKMGSRKVEALYNAVSDIDEDLILEAEGKTSGARKGVFKGVLALAACVALFVLLSFPLSSLIPKLSNTEKAESFVANTEEITQNKVSDEEYGVDSIDPSENGADEQKGSANTSANSSLGTSEPIYVEESFNGLTVYINKCKNPEELSTPKSVEALVEKAQMRTTALSSRKVYFIQLNNETMYVYDASTYELITEGKNSTVDSVAPALGIDK